MASTAPQIHNISTDETRNVSVDMTALLDDGETITGSPTVQCDASITVTNEQYNAAAVTINGVSVAAGKAVQFTVEPSARGLYPVEIVAQTSEGQTLEATIKLSVSVSKF